MPYEPNDRPTFYFIGVTTGSSSIMKLFPLWAEALGLTDARIKGMDLPIHASPELYREAVGFLKNDPNSLGALVTTHKIDLFHAARDLFDELDPYALQFEELSSISKQDGRLLGAAKDPISSGLAMEAFIPQNHWARGGDVFLMGAGGSALAISSYLTRPEHGDNIPSRIVISNRSQARLDSAKELLGRLETKTRFEYRLCPEPRDNDAVLAGLPEHSLVVNATGLGKDRPGSPLTDAAVFPAGSLVWELNYRGDLLFLRQAEAQREERGLRVEDGWIYFLHGWTQVIQDVFQIHIDKPTFRRLEQIALELQRQGQQQQGQERQGQQQQGR
ncbi:shikimate dehydrogenase family protein [Cohnella thailandensis]|uniref:Shikimate dehydrogenase n=1 Tax=Cohnella thailandensis TaxID=557557 RepID=A0A841SU97_9BACL|nr:shikimate dehydrogenase [Cohnella thailandensis]MBB6635893.1 shikimate dehydrogenase [Cohnella thailandensis]MBP1976271.1 shikimate 5-dehydrogenase [Cohnella thailandensis]